MLGCPAMEKGSTSSKLALFIVGSLREAPAKAKNAEGAQKKTWGMAEKDWQEPETVSHPFTQYCRWLRRAGICPPFVIDSSGRLQ